MRDQFYDSMKTAWRGSRADWNFLIEKSEEANRKYVSN